MFNFAGSANDLWHRKCQKYFSKKYKFFILIITIVFSPLSFANNNFEKKISAKFIVSNNTHEIDLHTAFARLRGPEQKKLQNEIIETMQKEHIEQGKFENIIGTYKMSSDQYITADNSEVFITSPYQIFSSEQTFKLAKELANILKQESVAVFIPDKQSIIGDTALKLKSHAYSINEIIEKIKEKLPIQYNQSFSIHLNTVCSNFDNITVNEVEWLGRRINPVELKKLFPQDEVTYRYGKAYLVYHNGQQKQL